MTTRAFDQRARQDRRDRRHHRSRGLRVLFSCPRRLGAGLGLGFLAQFEGVFINTLLPIFASLALVANVLSFFSHRIWYRLVAGIAGPAMVLATLYLFWTDNWSTYMFYAELAVMLAVAVWDIVSPPRKVCTTNTQTSGCKSE